VVSQVTRVRLFLASPGDVQEERRRVAKVVDEINVVLGSRMGFNIELVRWDTHTYPSMGRPQAVVNSQTGSYDVFLGLMWARFGSPTGEAGSGTEEEFNRAYAWWEEDPSRPVLFYFCDRPTIGGNRQARQQRQRVREFRSRLKTLGLVGSYSTADDLEMRLRNNLEQAVLDVLSSSRTFDQGALRAAEADRMSLEMAETSDQIVEATLAGTNTTAQSLSFTSLTDIDPVPLAPAYYCPRAGLLLGGVVSESRCVLTLVAGSGMGKTQIAKELYDQWTWSKQWVNVGGFESAPAERVRGQTARLVTPNQDPFLLVLDDLPNAANDAELTGTLASIFAACLNREGMVVITSPWTLPARSKEVLGRQLVELRVPGLDEAQISCVLSAAGAPEGLTGVAFSSLVLAVTDGHPALVAALTRWLASQSWAVTEDSLREVLSGSAVAEVRAENRGRVRALIDDESTRSLLDRLSLIGSEFSAAMVDKLATAEPALSRPRERLHELVGPWVSELTDSRFSVSPLLAQVGIHFLDSGAQLAVHGAIGEYYLGQRTVSLSEGVDAVKHLMAADEWLEAAVAYARILHAVSPEYRSTLSYLKYLFAPGSTWHASITLGIRLLIRTLQLRNLTLSAAEVSLCEEEIQRVSTSPPGSEVDEAGLAVAFLWQLQRDDQRAEDVARAAFELARRVRTRPDEFGLTIPAESLFWLGLGHMSSAEDSEALVAALAQATPEERSRVFADPDSFEWAVLLADSLYGFEADVDDRPRDWSKVLSLLTMLESLGRDSNIPSLTTAALRARAIVTADYLGKVDEAVALLAEPWDQEPQTSKAVKAFTLGRMLLAHGDPGIATAHFEAAINMLPHTSQSFLYFDALMSGSQAAALSEQWEAACRWAAEAVRVASRRTEAPLLRAELLAEFGWMLWKRGARTKSCAALFGAVKTLLAMPELESGRFNEVRWKVGHVLGWMASVASGGLPPQETGAGEVYVEPTIGFVSRQIPALRDLQSPSGMEALAAQLGLLASAVGLLPLAKKAYMTAAELGRAKGLGLFAGISEGLRATLEALNGDAQAAVECAVLGGMAAAVSRKFPLDSVPAKLELEKEAGLLTEEERAEPMRLFLFLGAVWPSFVRWMASASLATNAGPEMIRLRAAIQQDGRIPASDRDYWDSMFGRIEALIQGGLRRAELLRSISAIGGDDTYERIVQYLLVSASVDARPDDLAGSQATVLVFANQLSRGGDAAAKSLARWIVDFWRKEATERAFRLTTPSLLRDCLATLPEDWPPVQRAARVLQSASLVSGASNSPDLQQKLNFLSQPVPEASA
jgi:hypothetical protein